MFVFMRYICPLDMEDDDVFDIPGGTFYKKDVDDEFAYMVSADFDELDGIYDEVRRQGWYFDIHKIEDEELRESASEMYVSYIARVCEI